MERCRIDVADCYLSGWFRVAGVVVGCLLLIIAMTMLMRTAWTPDRAAILIDTAMFLSLPVVIAGIFLCAVGVILLALGEWRSREAMLTELAAVALLVLVVTMVWAATERAEERDHQDRNEPLLWHGARKPRSGGR
jgi:hypothetical protein